MRLNATELPGPYLHLSALESNIDVMRDWCAEGGVELAPHIKTTMTPAIVKRQLEAGAWGVTVATVEQGILGVDWGATRVLIANEVIYRPDLEALVDLVKQNVEVYFFVDSVHGVELAAAVGAEHGVSFNLLVDIGTAGGRLGVRNSDDALALAELVANSTGVTLAGIGAYEGVRPNSRDNDNVALIDAHCAAALQVLERVRHLVEGQTPLFTVGGSSFPDRAVEAIKHHRAAGVAPFTAVIRSGCYVTHDHGTYEKISPVNGLVGALGVRAIVYSQPEPGWTIVNAGRREVSYDAGLPRIIRAWSADGVERAITSEIATKIFDHHLVFDGTEGLEIGDVVELGISHPCTTFDKWDHVNVLDDDDQIIDVWPVRFHL